MLDSIGTGQRGETFDDAGLVDLVAALDNVDDPVVLLTTSGRSIFRNRAAREVFSDRVRLPPQAMATLRTGAGSWRGTLTINVRGEARRFATMIRSVAGLHSAPRYLLTAHDDTEVERLRRIASSVNLSDSIGHFLMGIRHELGNPVNSIKTALTVLRANRRSFSDEKVEEYLAGIMDQVQRMEFLLQSLRACTAHELLDIEAVPTQPLLTKIFGIVRKDLEYAGIRLVVEPIPDGHIAVDPRAFYQVMINLFSNAADAVSEEVTKLVTVTFEIRRSYTLAIAITDTGCGIQENYLERVGQPFYTTKRRGTGLGLPIVDRLVRRMDGSLKIERVEPKGTRVTVRVPFMGRTDQPELEDASK